MSYYPPSKAPTRGDIERLSESLWLEEQFWGHRLWHGQSPWLTFLEFLCVAASAHRAGHLFDADKSQFPSMYKALGHIHLRNILFNNEQQIARIAQTCEDSATAWATWLPWITDRARGLNAVERDFTYLRTRFESFQEFATLVKALLSCVVESDTNKRWSSRFIFPFGPAAIFEDLSIKDDTPRRDYVNFGRSGELLYHMLARSKHNLKLAEMVPPRLLNDQNKWNQLLQRLQPDGLDSERMRGEGTFLPYNEHPVFDIIAEDWQRLMSRNLPGFDVIPYLVTAGTFGLLLYQLHTSATIAGLIEKPSIVCEIVAPRRSLVRELSIESFEDNNALSLTALDKLIFSVQNQPEWNLPGSPVDQLHRRSKVLEDRFHWSDKDSKSGDPDDLFKQFRTEARERHSRYFQQVHRTFGRGIGLISRRGTNRFRYAPTDHFLKCIVFTTVTKRVEFGAFLAELHQRYGLVFGEIQAQKVMSEKSVDKKPFQQNASRLEQRLSSLGLLKRLSDACAYVENPYAG